MKINFFDLGAHEGRIVVAAWRFLSKLKLQNPQLEFSVYAVEACKILTEYISPAPPEVKIINKIISDHNGFENIYIAENGTGHSIFSTKNNVSPNFLTVECIKFSDWLEDNVADFKNKETTNIMKVNIEGAELHLFRDLIENDLVKYYDIFCGAGDDIEKIPELKDNVDEYYNMLKENNIIIHRVSDWKTKRNANLSQMIIDKLNEKY